MAHAKQALVPAVLAGDQQQCQVVGCVACNVLIGTELGVVIVAMATRHALVEDLRNVRNPPVAWHAWVHLRLRRSLQVANFIKSHTTSRPTTDLAGYSNKRCTSEGGWLSMACDLR